jgi:hypothetical protein
MPIVEGTYRRLLTADERGQLEAVIRKCSGSAALARRARRTCCLGPTASAGLTSEPSPRTAPRTGAVASLQLRWAMSRCLPCNASGASTGCNPRYIATNLSGAAHSLVPGLQLAQRTDLRARPEPATLPLNGKQRLAGAMTEKWPATQAGVGVGATAWDMRAISALAAVPSAASLAHICAAAPRGAGCWLCA